MRRLTATVHVRRYYIFALTLPLDGTLVEMRVMTWPSPLVSGDITCQCQIVKLLCTYFQARFSQALVARWKHWSKNKLAADVTRESLAALFPFPPDEEHTGDDAPPDWVCALLIERKIAKRMCESTSYIGGSARISACVCASACASTACPGTQLP